jgi:RNA polymerase sigma factor (sigma-70 family)
MGAAYLQCAGEDHRAHGEARLLRQEASEQLHEAVERLPPEDRRLVELRYFQGLEWKQVALELGLPERTVKDHDLKIRRRLRAHLEGRSG